MNVKTLREHKFRVLVMADLNGTIEEITSSNDDKLIERLIDDNVKAYASYMIEDFDAEEDLIDNKEEIDERTIELIKNFLRQINIHIKDIDKIIETNLIKWKIERLPIEDKNILRLCVYEMYYDDNIDIKIAINEAINIAKEYGNEKVGKFVNGILRSIYESKKV